MKRLYQRLLFCLVVVSGLVSATPRPAHPALYWYHNVQTNPITVCFVGDAVTNRPDRVDQILEYIREYEHYANIRFVQPEPGTWQCEAPGSKPDGSDYYSGDIRVAIPGANVTLTGPIPGAGCTADSPGSSWSHPPDERELHRSCLYNLKLGDDGDAANVPWLSHTLHEFGHALGLSHEHVRSDADDPTCTGDGVPGEENDGFMTPYDRDSVMHYEDLSCGIAGNYSHAGLSAWDKLAVHILYPEANRAAEFVGKTVIRSGEMLNLQSAWQWRGANTDFVAKNFQWRINGIAAGSGPSLSMRINTPGVYNLQFSYSDFLDRAYDFTGTVHVLTDAEYAARIAAVEGAQIAMRAEHQTTMIVPTETVTLQYQGVANPVMSIDKNEAKPLGVGEIAEGGAWVDVKVNLAEFTNGADVYLALLAPHISPDIFLIRSDLGVQSITEGIEPWMANTTGPIDSSIFGRIPTSVFPSGSYSLALLVTPAGSMDSHYLWVTQFTVP